MKIWKDGDRSRTICPHCERRTEVKFQRRTVELEHPQVRAADVLVGVCRECDGIATIPRQSTPKLKHSIELPKEVVNVRVPGHLLDVLDLVADRSSGPGRAKTATLVRLLLAEFAYDLPYARRVRDLVGTELAQGLADRDLSLRVSAAVLANVDAAAGKLGIVSRSEVIRGVIVAVKEDVLDERNPAWAESMLRALKAAS